MSSVPTWPDLVHGGSTCPPFCAVPAHPQHVRSRSEGGVHHLWTGAREFPAPIDPVLGCQEATKNPAYLLSLASPTGDMVRYDVNA